MKEFFEKLPITTILIAYFFICGGLYLIGYWSTFKLDITSFISLTDIPKSFVLPFVLANGYYIINIILNFVTTRHYKDKPEEQETETEKTPRPRWKRILSRVFSLDSLIMLTFLVGFILFDKYSLSPLYWVIFGFLLANLLMFKLTDFQPFKRLLPSSSLRLYISNMLIFLPVACFVIGKGLSLRVYSNDDIMIYDDRLMTLEDNKQPSDTLKFVGFIGDKVVVSSLDNKKIVFVNQASKDEIILRKK
ncbi:MAG: hypothetical protein N2044_06220 [Cyclobacteriaceae bacterium]|nr:hypothetical protein [Cyclobacteriaceae bacterium]MCX7637427.1 hypothetical protein [Cyclobacteriaceae bacterium]